MQNQASQVSDSTNKTQNGVPLVFLQERELFGNTKPDQSQWLKHEELYRSISSSIDPTHITGLQRVRGMWRIYLDNLDDKVVLMSTGVTIRGKTVPILSTNPLRFDGEETIRIRIQDIPLSADDGMIMRTLVLKGLDVISTTREKLRIDGKLTSCETGDRLVIVKSSSLKEPLSRFMQFAQFKARVIHRGQAAKIIKCSKCLETGHHISECVNDWKCNQCNSYGHKQADCPLLDSESDTESESPSESSVDKECQQGATGTTDNTNLNTSSRQHEDSTIKTQVVPQTIGNNGQRKQIQPKQNKTRRDGQILGQSSIINFVTHEENKTSTPNKQRNGSVNRSPPTPVELLQEKSKNTKKRK